MQYPVQTKILLFFMETWKKAQYAFHLQKWNTTLNSKPK